MCCTLGEEGNSVGTDCDPCVEWGHCGRQLAKAENDKAEYKQLHGAAPTDTFPPASCPLPLP